MNQEQPTLKTKVRLYQRMDIPKTGYIRLPAILYVLPIGRTSWLNGVKSGKFPKPVRLGPRTVAWRAEDIHQLLNEFAQQH